MGFALSITTAVVICQVDGVYQTNRPDQRGKRTLELSRCQKIIKKMMYCQLDLISRLL